MNIPDEVREWIIVNANADKGRSAHAVLMWLASLPDEPEETATARVNYARLTDIVPKEADPQWRVT